MEKDPTQPNFYEVSQERKSLRETLSEKKGQGGIEEILEKELADIKDELKGSVKEAGGISVVKELLKKGKQEAEGKNSWLDEPAIEG